MGPSREACDRCHAMKTRCVRTPKSQVCVRCTRLGISCNYSPPGRTGRPLGSSRRKAAERKASMSSSQVDGSSITAQTPSIAGSDESHYQNYTFAVDGQSSSLDDFAFFDTHHHQHQHQQQLQQHQHNQQQPCSDDNSMSLFLMESLLEDSHLNGPTSIATPPESNSQSFAASPIGTAASMLSSGQRRHHQQQPLGLAAASETYMHKDLLSRLLDMQSRLAVLLQSLSSGTFTHADVEDTYRVSEELIGVLDGVEEPTQFQASPVWTWSGSQRPGGVAALQMSSCYFSLIHAYELLVDIFKRELQETTPTNDDGFPGMCTQPQAQLQHHNQSPCISVGAVRLAMPRRAVAEINLHLVAQTVQHLKSSMQQCASRMAAATATAPAAIIDAGTAASLSSSSSSSASSLYSTASSHVLSTPAGSESHASWSSLDVFGQTSATASHLTQTALGELHKREENLFAHLRTKAF